MNVRKSFIKIVGWLILGAIFGIAGSFINQRWQLMEELAQRDIFSSIQPYFFWIHVIGTGLLLLISFSCYVQSKRIMTSPDLEEDEALSDKLDQFQHRALTSSMVAMILNFVTFGVSVEVGNLRILVSVGVFILVMLLSSLIDLLVIKQVREQDPMKKGDPSKMRFDKEWLESCDEAEKMLIYQSAYRTFSLMKQVLMFSVVAAMVSKMIFDTGNVLILVLGTIWLIHNLSYTIYARQVEKGKISI